ncbi:hypothetical protein [Oryza sativa Japonica Group]|uniref:Uncharacterized protein n=1 Tax=Oryza sativa subsp. japonica TaxID=39947 RepID=Q5NAT9_ORYSJ|nr:hypothetical protein [Oryza sativa Japonica Group]BAD81423.1 hypothetical protein [Oryza sativa Japonica Group]
MNAEGGITRGGAVREVLLTRWEGRDDQVLVYGLLLAGVDHGELMGRARFCLCPTGDDEGAAAASRRVVEAITVGCCAMDITVSFLRRRRRAPCRATGFASISSCQRRRSSRQPCAVTDEHRRATAMAEHGQGAMAALPPPPSLTSGCSRT